MTEPCQRVRDPEATRAAVLAAAGRLFAERGFAATSVRDISAASGVAHPLIHHHFGSKEGLYAAVKRSMVEGYARRFPVAARAANRPLRVKAEMRRLLTYFVENQEILRLCAWTRLEGDHSVWAGEPDVLDTLCSRIEVSQRRGLIRDDLDPQALSLTIFGLVMHWAESRDYVLRRYGKADDEAFLAQAVALVEAGIAPGARRGGTRPAAS